MNHVLLKNIIMALGIVFTLYAGYWLGLQKNSNTLQPPIKNIYQSPPAESVDNSFPPDTNNKKNEPNTADTPPAMIDIFQQLLQTEKYEDATRLYHNTWSLSQNEADPLRQLFIQHIKELIAQPHNSNPSQQEAAFSSYLSDFYDDTDILLLKALHQSKQRFYYDALDTLLLAKTYAYTAEQQHQVNTTYQQLMTTIDQYLISQNNPNELISVYLHAEISGLLTDENQFRLITLYLENDNIIQAKYYADTLEINPLWKEKIAKIMPTHNTTSETGDSTKDSHTESTVTLTKVAHQFIVNTLLSKVNAPLLIDTGASITTITEAFYTSIKRKSNLRFQSKQTFNTASGETTGSIYLADTFTIGTYTLSDIEIAVLDYPSSKYSEGLLGMNVLRHFIFEIDQQNSLLKLTPTETEN